MVEGCYFPFLFGHPTASHPIEDSKLKRRSIAERNHQLLLSPSIEKGANELRRVQRQEDDERTRGSQARPSPRPLWTRETIKDRLICAFTSLLV